MKSKLSTQKSKTSSFSLANNVNKVHVTTPTAIIDGGTLLGKVGFSTTTTKQNKNAGLFHSYFDIGNDASKYGIGVNAVDWLGVEVGVSSDFNVYGDIQLTSWIHTEVQLVLMLMKMD